MGWSIGYDEKWKRDIGYGVLAYCDHPECNAVIDRGLSYVCGGEPFGGSHGCGLHFCGKHLYAFTNAAYLCERCLNQHEYQEPFQPKPDHPDWIRWKLTDESWKKWRDKNPWIVEKMRQGIEDMEKVTAITDRGGVMFTAPNVRGILELRKKQTRRTSARFDNWKKGDRFYVRETWQLHSKATDLATVVYAASEKSSWTEFHRLFPVELADMAAKPYQHGWRPSIHMPRWAARIFCELTEDVRIELLHDISEVDAVVEGIQRFRDGHGWHLEEGQYYSDDPRESYFQQLEHLHGSGFYDSNPELRVISFKVIEVR